MRRRGRIAAALLLTTVMVGSAAGCGSKTEENPSSEESKSQKKDEVGSTDEKQEGAVLKVWLPNTFSEDADKLIEERCREFAESRDDVKEVKVEFISGTDGYAKWNAAIESGDVPDLTFLHITAYNNYAGMGVLEDLSDTLADVESTYGALIENHKENFTFDGKIYTLPLYAQINSMTYRTDFLEQAGANVPETWEDLREVSKKIKDAGLDCYGFGNGMGSADDGEDILRCIFRSFGARSWDEDGNVVINSKEAVDAVNYLADMYRSGYMPPSVLEWDASGNNTSYLAGESAIVFNPPTLYNVTQNDENKDTLGKVTSITALPKGDHESWSNINYIMFSIFNKAEQKDLAKDLLKSFFDQEWYDAYIESGFPVAGPVFEKTLETEKWKSDIGQQILPQSYLGRRYGYPSEDPSVAVADAKAYNDFVLSKTMQKVLLDNMSAEDAVSELEQELQGYLDAEK